MVYCEKLLLLELDEVSVRTESSLEMYLWAILWQLILIYRRVIIEDSDLNRSEPIAGKI